MGDIKRLGREGHVFHNWAKSHSCTPELYFEPKNVAELKQILKCARQQSKVVRVCGNGHSPSDIMCTTDYMVSMKHFNKVHHVDKEKNTVTVGGGILISDLNEELDKQGLGLSVLGSISDITLAGCISTGTHGHGHNHGLISSYIQAIELVTASGEQVTLCRDDQEGDFRAACLSLGALGVILTVTVQCEPAFNLHKHSYGTTIDDVLQNYNKHATGSEHCRILWYPMDNCIVDHGNRTTDKPNVHPENWLWDILIGVHLLEFLYWISSFLPIITMWINNTYFRIASYRSNESIDRSDKQFNMNCKFSQYVMEWAIPRSNTVNVLKKLKAWIEQNKFAAQLPIEIRPVKGDDLYLSPAYGGDCTYINIISYRPYGAHIEHETYWQAFQKIMMDAGGRPHWAKDFTASIDDLKKMYPKWNQFCEIRKKYDPNGVFLNDNLSRMFGHNKEAV